ncbi:hypothetical protein DIPPA_12251 [Diplonema papillatum]|nr:hypothetical protein DIPPA_12251 [Diplonema papillatum]
MKRTFDVAFFEQEEKQREKLLPWLKDALASKDVVNSFVDLRYQEVEGDDRNEQYREWLQEVAKKKEPGEHASLLATLTPVASKSLIRACVMDLAETSPLVTGSFMTLEASHHNNVSAWLQEEREKDKDEEEARAKEAAEAAEQKTKEDDTEKPAGGERDKKLRKVTKQEIRDFIVALPADGPSHVKAEASDDSATVRDLQVMDVVCAEDFVVNEATTWIKIRDGYIKQKTEVGDVVANFLTPVRQSRTCVESAAKGTPESSKQRLAAARLVAQYVRCTTVNLSKLGSIASQTPLGFVIRSLGGVKMSTRWWSIHGHRTTAVQPLSCTPPPFL